MKKVHLIGNAHLDPVWLWQWQEGFAEIKATFKSALDRMREFEDFKFTSACSAYYMWIEKSDPAMFAEIQKRVREGRWELTGGWMIQPDCNIPCGESFARHALISQRYFQEKFGKMAETGYNVDSFGHNGSLPMILRQSRMEHYVFMRPMAHEKELPAHLFFWESADGSRVDTYRIPFYYNIDCGSRKFEKLGEIAKIDEGSDQMAFYGIGNHGGGPTVELLRKMHTELDDRFVYSTTGEYFAGQNTADLPVVRDDLQYHAKGCYSAFSEIKKHNRMAENKLLAAERFSVLSGHLMGTPYPAVALKRGWHNVLFNQFHDIMGGCSIREAYDDARWSHGESMTIADREQNFALQQIGWNIDTVTGDIGDHVTADEAERLGLPIVVFNPHAHSVTTAVRIPSRSFGRANFSYVTAPDGRVLPVQQVRSSRTNHSDRYDNLFLATVPALGYVVYRGHATPLEAEKSPNPFTVGDNFVSNGHLRLTFDANGEVCGLYDEAQGKELLAAPTRLRLCDDEKNDTWAHGMLAYTEEASLAVKGSFRITEQGPVRVVVRTEQCFGDSRLIRDYILCANERTVTVSAKVDYHEKFGVLKLCFPVTDAGKCYAKIPFGHIERPIDGSEQVCGEWTSLGGLAVANDSKYSFDANGNELSLTVLRSALFADHYGVRDAYCEHMEQGEHTFSYSLSPFEGFAVAERQAAILQTPLCAYVETFHRGKLPSAFSGVVLSADNVAVTALKAHVSGKGTVLRCFETEGRDTEVKGKLFDTEFCFSIGHHAVKTLWFCDGTVTETDFIE
ncbi:MAG: alpha-mannosidase [Clostridia bacterium]|nr:alpha-mannosidase [Clostridia bacterium]